MKNSIIIASVIGGFLLFAAPAKACNYDACYDSYQYQQNTSSNNIFSLGPYEGAWVRSYGR